VTVTRVHSREVDRLGVEVRRDDVVAVETQVELVHLPEPQTGADGGEQDDEDREADPSCAQHEAVHTMTVVVAAKPAAAGLVKAT
jgi:hypothetical protein